MRTIGFLLNPIAGMGGRVGLKGTDGMVAEARERGAEPRAPGRAATALEALFAESEDIELYTAAEPMGGGVAESVGVNAQLVGPEIETPTSVEDTRRVLEAFLDREVDLVLFAGGDGTAVDVATTISEAGAETPILGVPAGVKIYSSVFAVTPRAAGRIAARYERVEPREINDIDEASYRDGEVTTELRGIARVPVAEAVQSAKQVGGGTVEQLTTAVAAEIREQPEVTYVLGPGSTLAGIKRELGIDETPLGVDVWRDGETLARDAGETAILGELGEENVVVVSPIGGQGFVFGRGNQQISPQVLERATVEVVASRQKLESTGVLRVDTGDGDVDDSLRGWRRVRVGSFERRLLEVV